MNIPGGDFLFSGENRPKIANMPPGTIVPWL